MSLRVCLNMSIGGDFRHIRNIYLKALFERTGKLKSSVQKHIKSYLILIVLMSEHHKPGVSMSTRSKMVKLINLLTNFDMLEIFLTKLPWCMGTTRTHENFTIVFILPYSLSLGPLQKRINIKILSLCRNGVCRFVIVNSFIFIDTLWMSYSYHASSAGRLIHIKVFH